MEHSLTVGELRALIKDLPDNLPVYASVALERMKTWPDEDYEYYINRARHAKSSSISNEHLSIELGKDFGW